MTIKVLIADDHQLFREGLRTLLNKQDDISVVAEASNGEEVLLLVQELTPDIVFMDISMSDMNGMEATLRLVEATPAIKVIALSMHLKKTFVKQMLKAGAVGYILKEDAFTEVVEAIRCVMQGQHFLCRKATDVLAQEYAAGDQANANGSAANLSKRDYEIVRLLANGKSSKEIALHMNLSVKTIDACRRRIMDLLHIHNFADLVKYAIREGLTTI